MNIYAIVILATILIGFLLELISESLNLKRLGRSLPEEFKDVYSEDRYRKSQEYTITRTKFGFITSTFSLAVTLVFWFSGGFNYLDQLIRPYLESEILLGLAYIGILMFASSLINLPFSIYSTFVIEEKFGFNKTTVKTFILDRLKGLLLSLLLGAPILALILWLLGELGQYAWLYAWGAVTLFTLIMQYIYPVFIMPLFNKFSPLEEGELRTKIFDYAKSVKYPLRDIYIMDGSKRSSKSNAFFTGFGKNKRIALFDTLIEKHSTDEIQAILAHEIGHFKKKHILSSMIISIIHMGIVFFLLSIFIGNNDLHYAFYMENINIYTGLIFFGMLYSPIELILSIIMNIKSRKNEFEADRYAAETIDNRDNLISALKKLSEHNLSNLTPHPFFVFLNFSHPPVLERILAIKNIQ
jgi:STE24 endopeptidase